MKETKTKQFQEMAQESYTANHLSCVILSNALEFWIDSFLPIPYYSWETSIGNRNVSVGAAADHS